MAPSSVATAPTRQTTLPLPMGKHSLRKRVRSFERRIAEHQAKLYKEMACPVPNIGVMRHWVAELEAFRGSLERARKRLGES